MTATVYTKPNCPPCRMTKRLLEAEGIPFTEASAEDHAEYLAGLGARSAPVTVSGETVIIGFVPAELRGLKG